MHDGVSLEKMGTPAATICTEGFRVAGESQAQALGMPEHGIIVIGHPLTAMPRQEVERQAQRAWHQAVRLLLGGE
ncbi:hypothetical protein C2W62_14225 [Candidatus Entotheonella serta]|nr:hypothetical protein C2W62_14225 [Candidatus Entotheonella serta]